jgi:hypothetical protein
MKYYGFSPSFLQSHGPLSWQHMSWALGHGLIGWKDLVQYANTGPKPSGALTEAAESLRNLDKESAHRANELADILAGTEAAITDDEKRHRWMLLTLDWVLTNRESFKDPLGEVEEIYADFDYPQEIAPLVRYMPPTDGWRPGEHSAEVNLARLFRLWADFVERKRCEYGWQTQ